MEEYVRRCNRCGSIVIPSENEEYDWQCMDCDEDLYGFETNEEIENE